MSMKYAYVHDTQRVKRFQDHLHRCVVINLRRAAKLGLDVTGFTSFEEEDYSSPLPEGDADPIEEDLKGGGWDSWDKED
jgi:hypothetical protein